jgi:hypothetical protein
MEWCASTSDEPPASAVCSVVTIDTTSTVVDNVVTPGVIAVDELRRLRMKTTVMSAGLPVVPPPVNQTFRRSGKQLDEALAVLTHASVVQVAVNWPNKHAWNL